ncbi:malic enzyme-like NAD(P)-binding protein [Shigella flexneri]
MTANVPLDDVIEGADIFAGLFRPESADPGNGEENGSGTNDPGAGEPGTGNSAAAGEEVRPDAIICTGRSDYPNQVNNVLCFPFIFRGALDVGATAINEEMKLAAVRAIAELAHAEQSEVVASAYGVQI